MNPNILIAWTEYISQAAFQESFNIYADAESFEAGYKAGEAGMLARIIVKLDVKISDLEGMLADKRDNND